MSNDFDVGMKVRLDGNIGLVIESPKDNTSHLSGIILWDTSELNDTEDWRGLWGTCKRSGGEVLPQSTVFHYIKIDDN